MKNIYSHFTAKERDNLSFPGRILRERDLLTGKILDFGCGLGKDVEILKNLKYSIEGYDPYYFNTFPSGKFDTVICLYVLNVLLPQEQATVINEISKLLKIGGKAYFAVRRDIKKPGFRFHKIHKKETYQCNVILPFQSIFKNENMEIYEYQHYVHLNKGKEEVSPFFGDEEPKNQKGEIATVFAIEDKFPVSKGHTLIIPKRKISNYFELSFQEQSACWYLLNLVKKDLVKNFSPAGFNIGININEAAGQTVPHSHIHIIPRYEGDVESPRGGVRGVIPSKKEYTS